MSDETWAAHRGTLQREEPGEAPKRGWRCVQMSCERCGHRALLAICSEPGEYVLTLTHHGCGGTMLVEEEHDERRGIGSRGMCG